jgi:hypothetical protein
VLKKIPSPHRPYSANSSNRFNDMRTAQTFSLMRVTLKVVLETALRARDVRSR